MEFFVKAFQESCGAQARLKGVAEIDQKWRLKKKKEEIEAVSEDNRFSNFH